MMILYQRECDSIAQIKVIIRVKGDTDRIKSKVREFSTPG